eukprot:scaffold966_cov191-Ochromonas_danica.AAC.3
MSDRGQSDLDAQWSCLYLYASPYKSMPFFAIYSSSYMRFSSIVYIEGRCIISEIVLDNWKRKGVALGYLQFVCALPCHIIGPNEPTSLRFGIAVSGEGKKSKAVILNCQYTSFNSLITAAVIQIIPFGRD